MPFALPGSSFEVTTDPFTYEITARVSDPDGQILSIELCIDDGVPSTARPNA